LLAPDAGGPEIADHGVLSALEQPMTNLFTRAFTALWCACGVLLAGQAAAAEAGLQIQTLPAAGEAQPAIPLALFYPTQAAALPIVMGPFSLEVAMRAEPDPAVKGLIVLSHGTGGSALGHSRLAVALARSGYLVAAIRHPGDNHLDTSLLMGSGARYFSERPRQLSRVIDVLLSDPQWKDRLAGDAKGPRVGAVGHSAGGYTVLALVGGRPDVSLIAQHCRQHRADDRIFCGMGRGDFAGSAESAPTSAPKLADPRVRAVVAMAPLGVVFDAASLAAIQVPVSLYVAEKDRWLIPHFHAQRIGANVNGIEIHRVANAWHFAFMDTPSMPIATPDGDIAADPPGFDRAAFLQRLGREVTAFFDKSLR
jgi:predicted dienelactone hydrolase